jgi:hypothetical protein
LAIDGKEKRPRYLVFEVGRGERLKTTERLQVLFEGLEVNLGRRLGPGRVLNKGHGEIKGGIAELGIKRVTQFLKRRQ